MDSFHETSSRQILVNFFANLLVVFFLATVVAMAMVKKGVPEKRGLTQSRLETSAIQLSEDD